MPLILGTLLAFCGVFVPYQIMPDFWKYWLYYLDVFTYIMGAILWFVLWDVPIICKPNELTTFDPPGGQTCGAYLETYLTEYNPVQISSTPTRHQAVRSAHTPAAQITSPQET